MTARILRKAALLLSTLTIAGGALAATAPSATAAPASSSSGAVASSDGWCHFSNWGGSFYCSSFVDMVLPNGYHQVFVVGTNNAVYTRWDSSSGLSKWTSLGGVCLGSDGVWVDWYNASNPWNFAIACIGTDGHTWDKQRYASGKWSGWYRA